MKQKLNFHSTQDWTSLQSILVCVCERERERERERMDGCVSAWERGSGRERGESVCVWGCVGVFPPSFFYFWAFVWAWVVAYACVCCWCFWACEGKCACVCNEERVRERERDLKLSASAWGKWCLVSDAQPHKASFNLPTCQMKAANKFRFSFWLGYSFCGIKRQAIGFSLYAWGFAGIFSSVKSL